jgi:hypothetical protein
MVDRTSDIAASAACIRRRWCVCAALRFTGFSDFQAVFRQAYAGQGVVAELSAAHSQADRREAGQVVRRRAGARIHRRQPLGARRTRSRVSTTRSSRLRSRCSSAGGKHLCDRRAALVQRGELYRRTRCSTPRSACISCRVSAACIREQIRSVKKGDIVIAISFAPYGKETQYCLRVAHLASGKDDRDHRQPALAARALRDGATVCEGGQRVCIPFADQYDLPVPGLVHGARVQARTAPEE